MVPGGSVLTVKKLRHEDKLTLVQAQALLCNCPCTPLMLVQKYTHFLLKNLKDVTSLTLLPVQSTCLLAVIKHINNLHNFTCQINVFRSDYTCFHCPGFSMNTLVLMIPTAKSMKSSFTVKNFALQK